MTFDAESSQICLRVAAARTNQSWLDEVRTGTYREYFSKHYVKREKFLSSLNGDARTLARGIGVSGENRDYFAQGRIRWLAKCLRELKESPRTVLDFGCGTGNTSLLFHSVLQVDHYTGVDNSKRSIEFVLSKFGSAETRFATIDQLSGTDGFDLAYCNGVFHHVPIAERRSATELVFRSLRPGGIFAFWENNPWNPWTRYVMSRIPFDRDAVPLSVSTASRMLRDAGCSFFLCRRPK